MTTITKHGNQYIFSEDKETGTINVGIQMHCGTFQDVVKIYEPHSINPGIQIVKPLGIRAARDIVNVVSQRFYTTVNEQWPYVYIDEVEKDYFDEHGIANGLWIDVDDNYKGGEVTREETTFLCSILDVPETVWRTAILTL
jgi:hypothetical protein